MPIQQPNLEHEYSVKQAAAFFTVKEQTIRRMCLLGRFKTAKKRFGCWFISREEIHALTSGEYDSQLPKPRNCKPRKSQL